MGASRRGYRFGSAGCVVMGHLGFSRPGRFTRSRLLRYDRREWKKCLVGAPLCASARWAHLSIRDRDAWVRSGLGVASLLVPVGIFFLRLNQWTAPRSTWNESPMPGDPPVPASAERPCSLSPQVHASLGSRRPSLSGNNLSLPPPDANPEVAQRMTARAILWRRLPQPGGRSRGARRAGHVRSERDKSAHPRTRLRPHADPHGQASRFPRHAS